MIGSPCYANGRPYFGLHTARADDPRLRDARNNQVIALTSPKLDWTRFWEIIAGQLNQHAYSQPTQELYRSILRSFYRHTGCLPSSVNRDHIRTYLNTLVAEHYSWNWIGMNISVLRTVFDKLGGKAITHHLATPKRPQHLPEILSFGEVGQILAAAPTTRDQLLLGFMYGCGLKVGEACRLRWADLDIDRNALHVRVPRESRARMLDLPPDLVPVLKVGHARCPSTDYIFQGRTQGTHLSTRMAQLILRRAVKSTNIIKPVTCMTLRHSFAVHCLEAGGSIRALREALGHRTIDTTLLYEDCILPTDVASPLDQLKRQAAAQTAEPEPPIATQRGAKLFTQALSVDALELPFRDETSGSRAGEFYRQLKTHILGRFLGSRRSTIRAG